MNNPDESRCPFTWNPGTWPYITRCVNKNPYHGGDCCDREGRTHTHVRGISFTFPSAATDVIEASRNVVDLLTTERTGSALLREKLRVLTMSWPSLAAALAALVEACEKPIPVSLRRAQAIVRGEDD